MELTLYHNGISYAFNTLHPIDISLGVKHDGTGVNCFYSERAVFEVYQKGNFIGNINEGGACNVDVIKFTAHANGTHTECIGHITGERQTITECLHQGIRVANLVTVIPESINGDKVITADQLKGFEIHNDVSCVIVRTMPNADSKKTADHSGTNPAYFSPEALLYLNQRGIKHLLCDIPSVDREEDGGKLLAHKSFFGVPDFPLFDATITELVYVPSDVEDGLYILDIQIAPFQSDASPSRPILYKMEVVF